MGAATGGYPRPPPRSQYAPHPPAPSPRCGAKRVCRTRLFNLNVAFGTSPLPVYGERVRVRGSLRRNQTSWHSVEDDTMDQRAELPPCQQITHLEQAAEHIRRARRILVGLLRRRQVHSVAVSCQALRASLHFARPGRFLASRLGGAREGGAAKHHRQPDPRRPLGHGRHQPVVAGHQAAADRFRHMGPDDATSLHQGCYQPMGEMDWPHTPGNGPRLNREDRFRIPALHLDLQGEIFPAHRRRHRRTWPRCAGSSAKIPPPDARAS
ncbi:hypothetical protein ABID08_002125 [Rhizobium binae]|uniref:Uncharacterized protein n=1 Tax=Rhizobium binae TaxID=1138190 RepID=A0ABV2MH94_9HYPH